MYLDMAGPKPQEKTFFLKKKSILNGVENFPQPRPETKCPKALRYCLFFKLQERYLFVRKQAMFTLKISWGF